MLKKLLVFSTFFNLGPLSSLKAISQIMCEEPLQEREPKVVARKLDEFLTTQKIDDPQNTTLGVNIIKQDFCVMSSNVDSSQDEVFFTHDPNMCSSIINNISNHSFKILVDWMASNQKNANHQQLSKILFASVKEEKVTIKKRKNGLFVGVRGANITFNDFLPYIKNACVIGNENWEAEDFQVLGSSSIQSLSVQTMNIDQLRQLLAEVPPTTKDFQYLSCESFFSYARNGLGNEGAEVSQMVRAYRN